jgi:hypothetical protein
MEPENRPMNLLTSIAVKWIKKHSDEGNRIFNLCPFVKNNKCTIEGNPHLEFLRKKCPRMCEKYREERHGI